VRGKKTLKNEFSPLTLILSPFDKLRAVSKLEPPEGRGENSPPL